MHAFNSALIDSRHRISAERPASETDNIFRIDLEFAEARIRFQKLLAQTLGKSFAAASINDTVTSAFLCL